MALVCRVFSAAGTGGCSFPRKFQLRFFCNKVAVSNPLLSKLLQIPNSQIKTTLDSEDPLLLNNSSFSWDTLLTSLRSSSPQKAQSVLEWRLDKMLKENKTSRDYSDLISLCGKIRNIPLAMLVFSSMERRGIKPNSSVFNSLIYTCLCSGDVVTSISLFETMMSSEDYKPNSETYDFFIAGFSSLGNVDAMHTWYSAKKAAGFPANVQTYESLISGCVKSKDFDGADKYYEEMMSIGVMPSITILESVLEGLCKRGSLGQVEEFMEFLLDAGWKINENMAEKLVKFYCEPGKVDEMEELLATLIKYNQDPQVLLQVHCGIIRIYALSDRLDDVEYSVGRMGKQGLSFKCPDDVEKVICSYFRCEEYNRLELCLDHIKSSYKLTRSNYDFLIAGYRRAGLSEKVDLVIKDMKLAGIL
ncbi:hypothetical protein Pint_12789 [Pistacia integerrima]|uniref:Uncharacterized protein n=1 Tax=Pistacia integerrima TaxID=434235 RepID=A0ACC0Y5F8_9ROSI|nr:hypothetical protein Pint_12789 [Pistacia integerrima]